MVALENVDSLGGQRRTAERFCLLKLVGNVDLQLAVVAVHLGPAENLGISNLRETMEHKADGDMVDGQQTAWLSGVCVRTNDLSPDDYRRLAAQLRTRSGLRRYPCS